VHDEDEMTELMTATPIGKTVDIEFLRDGEKKTTKLTTISNDENRRLGALFDKRPEGRGRFGYEDSDTEEVAVPGTNITGVRLDNISQSLPADLAGIKRGDIVIQFGDTPIRTRKETSHAGPASNPLHNRECRHHARRRRQVRKD
jgi:S1-C subfamily serine protease